MRLSTVKIANPREPGGYMIINEADFDPSRHVLFGADAGAKVALTPAPEPAHVVLDGGERFSDAELRTMIRDLTGKAPHPRTGRAKLLAQFNDANAPEQD